MEEILNIPIPIKVRIFLWMMFKGRIQVAKQLKKMNWPGSLSCNLSGEIEGVDHLIFQCPLAMFFCCCIRDAKLWDRVPNARSGLLDILHCPGPRDHPEGQNISLLCVIAGRGLGNMAREK